MQINLDKAFLHADNYGMSLWRMLVLSFKLNRPIEISMNLYYRYMKSIGEL